MRRRRRPTWGGRWRRCSWPCPSRWWGKPSTAAGFDLKERTNQINQFYNCTFNFDSNQIEYCCLKIVTYLEQILENNYYFYQPPVKFSDYYSNCNPETVITLIASLWIKLDRLYLNLLLFLLNKTGCFLPGEAEMLPANREVTSALRDHFPHSVKNEKILLKIWRIDEG